jgi:hypothetical protein
MAPNGTDVNEMTLTFVESGRPRELFAHLQEKRGFSIEEKKAREIAKNLLGNGISLEQTAQLYALREHWR